jgi:hypothetical protein
MPPDAPAREKPFAVLGLALGLLVVLTIYVAPLVGGARKIDGAAYLAAHFEPAELPFGFAVTRAVALRDGRRVVVAGDPSAPPEVGVDVSDLAPEGASDEEPAPLARGDSDREVWARLKEGEPGRPPRAIALVHYPLGRAGDVLRRQFGELQYKDLTHVDEDGEAVPVDSGYLTWGAYQANYVRLRHFAKDDGRPTFHDTLRVNLTVGERCWIAYLRWDPFLPGAKHAAEQLLRGLGARSG